MNLSYDINVHPGGDNSLEEARRRFLGSLGVSDGDHSDPESIETTDSIDEKNESLILSSGPDDLELPGAGGSIPERFSSHSILEEADRPLSSQVIKKSFDSSIAITVQPEVSTDSSIPTPSAAVGTDLNEVLDLSCPECEGELVLSRRHIGVEGACVWCHTSIIATESPLDGTIRIFPILGRQQPKSESTENVLPPPPVLQVEENIAEPVIEIPVAITESIAEMTAAYPVIESPAAITESVVEMAATEQIIESPAAITESVVEMTIAAPVIESPAAITESVVEMAVAEPVVENPVAITESVVEMTVAAPVIENPVAITESVVEMTVAAPVIENPVAITESVVEMTVAEPMIESPAATTESVVEMTVVEPVIESPVAIYESVVEMLTAEPEVMEVSPSALTFGDFLNPANPVNSAITEELRFAAGEFTAPIELTPELQGFFSPVDATTGETQSSSTGAKQEIPLNKSNEPRFPTGFGAFLSDSISLTECTNVEPAVANPSTEESVPLPTEPEIIEFSGFQSPSPWGPPTKIAADIPATPPIDRVPTNESDTPFFHDEVPSALSLDPMEGFASAFGPLAASAPTIPEAELPNSFGSISSMASDGITEPIIESFQPTAGLSSGDDFAAAFSSVGFTPPPEIETPTAPTKEPFLQGFDSLPFIEAKATAVCDIKNTQEGSLSTESGFSFHNSPLPQMLFGNTASTEKRTFSLPSSDFSTGSSFQEEVSVPPLLDSENHTLGGISETIGLSNLDAAPNDFPPYTDPTAIADNLFSESPVPVMSSAVPPALPAEHPASSATPTEQPLASHSLGAPAAPRVTPTVVSQPFGTKSKTQVRKGFVVLMVVILGFACGGALASFVLPVDEYVQTARTYMEQKFSVGSVIQQVPAAEPLASDASSTGNRNSQP